MPAWGLFMKKVYDDNTLIQYRRGPFKKPENFVLDCGRVTSDSTDTYIPLSTSDDEGTSF
jgi:penicillin-binding protein 1A